MRRILLGCIVSMWMVQVVTGSVLAQETPPPISATLTETDFLGEIPIALSASRLKQSMLDAPVSITIIDREIIKASGLIDLPDLMQFVPGFQVAHANGNLAVVTYHGIVDTWPKRMQVLVDGRSVYLPLLSNVDFTTLGVALDDVERIEVVQGSDAPAYGSNAFLATINIITRQPFQQRGAFLQLTAGSLDTRAVVARYADAIGKFDYRITANYRGDDGFDNVNDGTRERGVNFRSVVTPSATDTVDLQVGYNDGSLGAWGGGTLDDRTRDKRVQNSYFVSRWQRTLSSTQDIAVQFYHNQHRQRDAYPGGPLSEFFGTTPQVIEAIFGQPDQTILMHRYDGEVQRDDVEIQHTAVPYAELRVAWGGGARSDRARSVTWFNRSDWVTEQDLRLFMHAEWRFSPNFVANAGVMTERNSVVGTATSPRLGLNYSIADDHVIRIAISRARRTPSLWESNVDYRARFNDGSTLFLYDVGRGDLKPERLTSSEIGYRGEARARHWDWDVKLFRERYRGLINAVWDYAYPQPYAAVFDNGTETYLNAGSASLHGGEARLSYRPGQGTLFSLQYNYTRASGQYLVRLNPIRYRAYSIGEPMHTVSAMGSYAYADGWQISASITHMDDMRWMGDGDRVDGHDRYDARIAKSFAWNYIKGEVALIGQNLSESYVDFERRNIFEQRAYLQLSLQF